MSQPKADANPPENNEEVSAEVGAESGIGSGTEGGTESGIESGPENNSTSIHVESDAEPKEIRTEEEDGEEEEVHEAPSEDTVASGTRSPLRRRRRSRSFPKIFLIPTLVLLATVIFAVLLIINVIIKYNKNKRSLEESGEGQTPAYPLAFDVEKEKFDEIKRQSVPVRGESLEKLKENMKPQTNFVLKNFTGLRKISRTRFDDIPDVLLISPKRNKTLVKFEGKLRKISGNKSKIEDDLYRNSMVPVKSHKKEMGSGRFKSKSINEMPKYQRKDKMRTSFADGSSVRNNLKQLEFVLGGKLRNRTNLAVASDSFGKKKLPSEIKFKNHKNHEFFELQDNLSSPSSVHKENKISIFQDRQTQLRNGSMLQKENGNLSRFYNNSEVDLSRDALDKKLIEQKGSFLTAMIAAAASEGNKDGIVHSLNGSSSNIFTVAKIQDNLVGASTQEISEEDFPKETIKILSVQEIVSTLKSIDLTPNASSMLMEKNLTEQLSKSSNAAISTSESIANNKKSLVHFIGKKLNFSDATQFCRQHFNSNLFVPLNEEEEKKAMEEYKQFIAENSFCAEVTLGHRMILSKQWHSSSREQYFFGHLSNLWSPLTYQYAYRTCVALQFRKRSSQFYLTNKQCSELVTCHLCSKGPLPCIDESCLFFVKLKDTAGKANQVCRQSDGVAAEVYNFRQLRTLLKLVRILPKAHHCINFSLGMTSSPAYENSEEKEINYIPKRFMFSSRLAKHSCTAIRSETVWLRSSCWMEKCFVCG